MYNLIGDFKLAHPKNKTGSGAVQRIKEYPKCMHKRPGKAAFLVLLTLFFYASPSIAQTPPAGFSNIKIGSEWQQPLGVAFTPDGARTFVWEKGGKVWSVQDGVKNATPFIDISQEVGNWRDYGLLGFAFDPNFASNGYIYLLYVVDRHHLFNYGTASYKPTSNAYNNATIGRLTRYTATASSNFQTIDINSRKVLLGETRTTGIPIMSTTHGVGSLVFGTDGTLLVSCGDGASYTTTDTGGGVSGSYAVQAETDGIIRKEENVGAFRSQMLSSLNGKVLRLDPATGNGVASNPFYDPTNPRSAKSRTWAVGLRNPYRMTLRPGTGSQFASDGNPGILYIGDVGWNNWEELNIADKGGLNFGWPIFEGLEANPSYSATSVPNADAPNPQYNVSGCTQQYFYFTDLIKQATQNPNPTFPNPCNASQQIPAQYTFLHTRPAIDWKHGKTPLARTGTFSGENATVTSIGAAGSPVVGSQFSGNSSTAGVWYTGDAFPAEYKNSYFHGDYAAGWIRKLDFDGVDRPLQVNKFIDSSANVIHMTMHPTDGSLYYVHLGTVSPFLQEVHKVFYSANHPPEAIASANKTYGPGPLTVQFTGSQSVDPEGQPLTYAWNFGDGSAISTAANPSYTFTAPAGVPKQFNVTLKITDVEGASSTTTLAISVNNTPPVATITSPVNNSVYSMTDETTYNLTATVSDAQQGSAGFSYQWQTILHHNNHVHEEPIDTQPATTTLISPVGCDGEDYYYSIVLIVTDNAGLTDTAEVRLYPNCQVDNFTAEAANTSAKLTWQNPPLSNVDEVMIVAKATNPINAKPSGNGSAYTANLSFTGAGTAFDGGKVVYKGKTSPQTVTNLTGGTTYHFKAFVRKGSVWSTGVNTSAVLPAMTPTCSASGTIRREVWTNIPGKAVSTIPVTTTPNSSSQLTLFEAPTNEADNFGARVRGYICAPQTGNYTFWIACDDDGELWLSTDDQPTNKVKIAYVTGYTAVRRWDAYASQKSALIPLVAGRTYYIEALHKEATGGDNLAVGWQLPNAVYERPIPGNRLSPFVPAGNVATTPSNFQASAISASQINLSWTDTANESNYIVERASSSGGAYVVIATLPANTTSYANTGLSASTTYFYRIKSTNASGSSAYSSAVSAATMSAACTASGTILREVWTSVAGNTIADIPLSRTPNGTSQLTLLEGPTNLSDNYGARIRGYVCPPATGSYTFFVSGNNDCDVLLSTDDNPANKRRIAYVAGSTTGIREWTRYPNQQSAPITLTANKRYYIEVLHKEGGSGDHVAVGWQLPSGIYERPIPGNRLSPFVPTTGSRLAEEQDASGTPGTLEAYPNPFSDQLTITFAAHSAAVTSLILFDSQGKPVKQLFDGTAEAEMLYSFNLNHHDLKEGLYIIQLVSEGKITYKKVIMAR